MSLGAGHTAPAMPLGFQRQHLIPRTGSYGATMVSTGGCSSRSIDAVHCRRVLLAPIPQTGARRGADRRPAFAGGSWLASMVTRWIPAFVLSGGLLRGCRRPATSWGALRLCRRGLAVQLHAQATAKTRSVATATEAPAVAAPMLQAEEGESSDPSRFLIIDGYSLLFAAFYGVKTGLRNERDEPIGALMTVAKQLLALQRTWPATHCAVMLDTRSDQLVKKALLPEYKANRQAAPDELIQQLVELPALCEGFGIRPIQLQGYEADDLIGVYAHEASKHCSVIIVSRDKDLLQLVSDDRAVAVYDPKNSDVLDSAGVEGKLGVLPDQVPDWLALVGDNSDNVRGVPGFGAKRAARLLQAFGDLEGIFEAAREPGSLISGVGPKLKRALLEHEEQAIWMRDHVLRLPTALPALIDPTAFREECEYLGRTPEGQEQMLECCQHFGFYRLHDSIAGGSAL